MRERTEAFKQGQKDYNNGVKIQSQTTYNNEYLNGWLFAQRLSKGRSESWNMSTPTRKSSSNMKGWYIGRSFGKDS